MLLNPEMRIPFFLCLFMGLHRSAASRGPHHLSVSFSYPEPVTITSAITAILFRPSATHIIPAEKSRTLLFVNTWKLSTMFFALCKTG